MADLLDFWVHGIAQFESNFSLEPKPLTGLLLQKVQAHRINYVHVSFHSFAVTENEYIIVDGYGNWMGFTSVLQRKFPGFLSPGITKLDVWTCTIQVGTFEQENDATLLSFSRAIFFTLKSRRGNAQLSACDELLFHHEDRTVKKFVPGLRTYQKERASLAPLSRSASMTQINTKMNAEYLRSLESDQELSKSDIAASSEKPLANNIYRVVIFGGVIVLACSLAHGLLNQAFIFGVGRRPANRGKRSTECCET